MIRGRGQVVGLQTGQAIVFAPSGLGVKNLISIPGAWESYSTASVKVRGVLTPFGQGYLLVRSRQRITLDGGHSLLAVPGSVPSNEGTTIVDEDEDEGQASGEEEEEEQEMSDDGDASDGSELDVPGRMPNGVANEEYALVRLGQRNITHDGGRPLLAITNGTPRRLAIEGPTSIVQDEERTSNDSDGSDASEPDVQAGSVPDGIIVDEEHLQDPQPEMAEGGEGEEGEESGGMEDISSDSGFETCVDEDEDEDEDTPVAETTSAVAESTVETRAAEAEMVDAGAVVERAFEGTPIQVRTDLARTMEETPVQVRTDLAKTAEESPQAVQAKADVARMVEPMGSSSSSEPVEDRGTSICDIIVQARTHLNA